MICLLQLGVYPSVHVFSSPGKARFENRMGLERSCSTCKNAVTFATRKANLDCWKLEWTLCQDDAFQVDDWHFPLASFFKSFQCTPTLWTFASDCRALCQESVVVSRIDWWRTFLTNCEEIHNDLSKLKCRSHIAENCVLAMTRGVRQAMTRIGCLQALESGPTVEEPCLAEMAGYDRVYCDSVTGASLPSELCEEPMQLEIKYMQEMNVYTPCEHEAVKEQGLTPIGTRWVFTHKVIQNILSSVPDWLLRRRRRRQRGT